MQTKKIELPIHGIVVELVALEEPTETTKYNGSIITELHAVDANCDNEEDQSAYDAAVNGLESMILACACAGIDIEAPAFISAIETTVDAICCHCD